MTTESLERTNQDDRPELSWEDIDLTILDEMPVERQVYGCYTDDGCGSTCESACTTSC